MKLYLQSAACLAAMGVCHATPAVVLVGWDEWASGSEPANITSLDASGNAVETGDWRESLRAASNDATFGTVAGASAAVDPNKTGTYIGITGDGAYTFTINAGDAPLSIEGFHFDAKRKRTNSPENWEVEVTAGDITLGVIGSGTLTDVLGGIGPSDHDDFDFDLTSLADNVLDPGQSATFVLSFTGGNPTNSDQRTYLDNVAITGDEFTPGGPAADLSGDGDVDDEDLGLFFSAFTGPDNGPSLDPRADLSGDGDVDDEDLGAAFSEFTGPLGPASVPEPNSLALLGIGGLALARRRRA